MHVQVQQEAMARQAAEAAARQEAVAGEVAALRRELAGLHLRRDDFLWL